MYIQKQIHVEEGKEELEPRSGAAVAVVRLDRGGRGGRLEGSPRGRQTFPFQGRVTHYNHS
jgi:hypothetical protein